MRAAGWGSGEEIVDGRWETGDGIWEMAELRGRLCIGRGFSAAEEALEPAESALQRG
ncbi:MAG: hypothetical protein RI897_1984 [Verrucomicrobiota bacterium]